MRRLLNLVTCIHPLRLGVETPFASSGRTGPGARWRATGHPGAVVPELAPMLAATGLPMLDLDRWA